LAATNQQEALLLATALRGSAAGYASLLHQRLFLAAPLSAAEAAHAAVVTGSLPHLATPYLSPPSRSHSAALCRSRAEKAAVLFGRCRSDILKLVTLGSLEYWLVPSHEFCAVAW
jgi:hypothetical protein